MILNTWKEKGDEITIPLHLSCNPLEELRAVDVGKNPFRLAVSTLWLKYQPRAFKWFEKILQNHEALVREGAAKLQQMVE